ncbi:hypothetical protein LTV02_32410 [Nocardia yamanashiensis]|uniref:hypothetical protein n=1 Tax=Nocardia yamanashiensis TaxID=209247 RepID=UPI001E5235B0|nr:hypothetical protein [Nocardia yamanashiensis]UGT46057.1 hypothetical protein LTV02_32410 [Nocardia yamanashiensis]
MVDLGISVGAFLVGVVAMFGFGNDLFGKFFQLVHNRCTAKKDFSVQCDLVRPPSSALWGLMIAGGGMSLALITGLVLTSVAALTGRKRPWLGLAIAVPVILVAGAAGHVLVSSAIAD